VFAGILRVEVEACADQERRGILLSLIEDLCLEQRVVVDRSDQMLGVLQSMHLSLPDAVHIVSAFKIGADIIITCDKQLLKMGGKIKLLTKLSVMSPLQALAELSS